MGDRTVTIDTKTRTDDGTHISTRTPTYTVSTVLGTVYRVADDTEDGTETDADAPQHWYARPLLRNRPIGAYPNIERAIRALLEETLR
jgi:hypothetical protein